MKDVGFLGLVRFFGTKWCDVDIFGGVLFETFIMNAAGGKCNASIIKWDEEFGDEIWLNFIIGVDETNVSSGSAFETRVSGGRLTGIFLMENFNASVFFCVIVGNFPGIISGTIVD